VKQASVFQIITLFILTVNYAVDDFSENFDISR